MYFHDVNKAGFFPDKVNYGTQCNIYIFRETSWEKGVILTVDERSRAITRNSDKSFLLLSLTKNSVDWEKTKNNTRDRDKFGKKYKRRTFRCIIAWYRSC